jgi:RNA recognition motif-containing protein
MTIYIGNIPYSMDEEKLLNVFQKFGPIESVRVIVDNKTKRPKGYAFVEMKNASDEKVAVDSLNEQDIGGRKARVSIANPKKSGL